MGNTENSIMNSTSNLVRAAILLSLMHHTHVEGASLAGLTPEESTVYVVDGSDLLGPAAAGVSPGAGSSMVCVNNFIIAGDYTTIAEVSVQWSLMLGTSYFSIGIWSDPNQDGSPGDAILLTSSPLTPAVAGEFLQLVQLPSLQYIGLAGTSFFAGVFWHESAQQGVDLFMGRDRPLLGASPSWQKTWATTPPDPSDLSGASVYQGSHRAFVIRPTGVIPEPSVALLLSLASWALTLRSRTRRRS